MNTDEKRISDEYCPNCKKITPHFPSDNSCCHCGWVFVEAGKHVCESCSVKTVGSDKRADVKHCSGCDVPEKDERQEVSLADLLNAQDKLNGMISAKLSETVAPTPNAGLKDQEPNEPPYNPVYRPLHYTQWLIEPFTFLMLNEVPFAEGAVIKYVMRWRKKNGVEDLLKAVRILEMMVELEENREDYIAKKTCL